MSTRKPTALWIRVMVDGVAAWINSVHVRRIQYDHRGRCQIVYTSQDKLVVDQPMETVMAALGYKVPAPPPLETHETLALEDQVRTAEFAGPSGGE